MLRGFALLYARAVIDRSILQAPGLTDAERARRALALELAEAALAAVEPERATRAALARLEARGVPLTGATIFAFGKASVGMARAALAACAPRGGIVVAPGPAALPPLEVRVGGHPTPAPDAIETGDRVLALARSLGPGDVALCLISGGGSSMLERPRDLIALETVQRITRALLAGGADIGALNTVRRALSAVKGGRLAAAIGADCGVRPQILFLRHGALPRTTSGKIRRSTARQQFQEGLIQPLAIEMRHDETSD